MIAAFGLVIVVTGTFLRWLDSGVVGRNSYQAVAVAGTVLAAPAFRLWTVVPLLCAVCVVLFVLGLVKTAATATLLTATAVGIVAAIATSRAGDPGGPIGVSVPGPVTTLAGAGIALLGALGSLLVRTPEPGGSR